MKLAFGFLVLAFAQTTFAAQVLGVKLDASKQNLLIDVRYGGGCKKHEFSLQLQGCLESFPVQCKAQLLHKHNNDFCEAMISETVVISLKESGIEGSYFKRGSLTIMGDRDFTSNKPTQATVRLP
jgi:hypothetical protein